MVYSATVVRVMIASPSDVSAARDEVEKAIYSWNDANAKSKQVILQPWRWETSSVPVMGGHPQQLINAQGVDDSDIVFAIFGARLGSPTPEAISGTAEEIDRAIDNGKPVHVYFSNGPLPNDVETSQLDALRQFKDEMRTRGLLGEFSNVSQLSHEVWKVIEHDINALDPSITVPSTTGLAAPVEFSVQPGEDREISGYTTKGVPRYTTRHWIDVTNVGTQDAEMVTFEGVGDSAMHLGNDGAPTVIHHGQTRRIHVFYTFGGSSEPVLRIRWIENGEQREKDFHVG